MGSPHPTSAKGLLRAPPRASTSAPGLTQVPRRPHAAHDRLELVLPRSLQSTRSTPTLPGHEGRLRVPPRSRRCGGETSNHLLFRIVVAPQLEADRALCRRSAVVSGDCCARPTVTGAGRQYGAVVTACCRTLRGSVSQNRSTICFTASSLHRRSKPTMLYDVVRPSSIVDWRRLAGVRAYCRTRIGP